MPSDALSASEYVDWYLESQSLGGDPELIEVGSGPSAISGRRYRRSDSFGFDLDRIEEMLL